MPLDPRTGCEYLRQAANTIRRAACQVPNLGGSVAPWLSDDFCINFPIVAENSSNIIPSPPVMLTVLRDCSGVIEAATKLVQLGDVSSTAICRLGLSPLRLRRDGTRGRNASLAPRVIERDRVHLHSSRLQTCMSHRHSVACSSSFQSNGG